MGISQLENRISSKISKSGQFIDITRPATCYGEISTFSFCYSSHTEQAITATDITLHIWRFIDGSKQILEIVNESSYTVPVNFTDSMDMNTSCNSISTAVEKIQFQRGDILGYLLPPHTGLSLTLIDEESANEGVGIYRDNRPVESYGSPLNLETDLEIETGLRLNIQVEVTELSVNESVQVSSLLASTEQNSVTIPSSINNQVVTPTPSLRKPSTPATMLTNSMESLGRPNLSMNSVVHTMSHEDVHSVMLKPSESLPQPVSSHDSNKKLSLSIETSSIADTISPNMSTLNMSTPTLKIFIPSFSFTPTTSSITTISMTKSDNNSTQSPAESQEILTNVFPTLTVSTVMATDDDDSGLLRPYTTYDEDTISKELATHSALYGKNGPTSITNTHMSFPSPVIGTRLPSHSSFPSYLASDDIITPSLEPIENTVEETPLLDINGDLNGGSGESEFIYEAMIGESTALDNEQVTLLNTVSFIPSSVEENLVMQTLMEIDMSSELDSNDDVTTSQNEVVPSATIYEQVPFQSSLEPTLSSKVITMPIKSQSSFEQMGSPIFTSLIVTSEITIPRPSLMLFSSTDVVDTTSIQTFPVKNPLMSSIFPQSNFATTSHTETPTTSREAETINIVVPITTPTYATTTNYSPDYKPDTSYGLATWIPPLVLMFAVISGSIMFLALYFAHCRKITKGKGSSSSSPNGLSAIGE